MANLRRDLRVTLTPLWLIAGFLSLTEIVAGVTLMRTSGNIQMILTVFVVTFPVFVAIVFFLILLFRNYVLFSPTEYEAGVKVGEFVSAMRGDEKTILQQYDSAAHALFGVVDALEREAPAVLKGRKSVLPREFVAETNMAERGHRLSRISAGSVPRDEVAKIYPFLAERFTSISTMNHIRSCLINEASFLFFLSPYVGTQTFDRIEDIEAKIGEIDKISNRDYDEVVGFFVEFIDNQLMVFLCYGDRIVLSSALQLEILKLSDTITDAIYPDALIITERGDIIGTIRDIARKRRSKITSGPVGGVVASGR